MERLTEKNDETYFYPHCFEECDGAHETCSECEFDEKVCMRIGKYEDTGLTPEQIMELVDRDTARAPVDIDDEFDMFVCPNCDMAIGTMGDKREHHFCLNCGQRLMWEE